MGTGQISEGRKAYDLGKKRDRSNLAAGSNQLEPLSKVDYDYEDENDDDLGKKRGRFREEKGTGQTGGRSALLADKALRDAFGNQMPARVASFRTVFQLRPVERVTSLLSITALVNRDLPIPFG
jgi:hypothetical protein